MFFAQHFNQICNEPSNVSRLLFYKKAKLVISELVEETHGSSGQCISFFSVGSGFTAFIVFPFLFLNLKV